MTFGPAASDPRLRRSWAHTMIGAHREGRVSYDVAEQAVERASHTRKGAASNFEISLARAAISPVNVLRFGQQFAAEAVEYREEPFRLRAGGTSHWYVDARQGLARGDMLSVGSRLMVASARTRNVQYDVVTGMGVAGSALATGVMVNNLGIDVAWGNDSHAPDQRYGFGLHGADVEGKRVWVVDDTSTTGDSLVTLVQMVRERGGIVEHADVLTDRSGGKVQDAVGEIGVRFNTLLVFDESSGEMRLPESPSAQTAPVAPAPLP